MPGSEDGDPPKKHPTVLLGVGGGERADVYLKRHTVRRFVVSTLRNVGTRVSAPGVSAPGADPIVRPSFLSHTRLSRFDTSTSPTFSHRRLPELLS
jgi:hypothetical protein